MSDRAEELAHGGLGLNGQQWARDEADALIVRDRMAGVRDAVS